MLVYLCALSSSVTVPVLPLTEALAYARTGAAFIVAASSTKFSYPRLIHAFTRAAHLSCITDAKFAVLDVASGVDPSSLNITYFPVVLYLVDGIVKRTHSRGFDEELILAFINTQSVSPPAKITTQEELQQFYAENALGLIAAVPDASKETLPELDTFYRDHFNELTLAFVDPALVDKPGFYLYRYADASLVELPDLDRSKSGAIGLKVAENLVFEFVKFNGFTASLYERENQTYIILMLGMEDFYLTPEQLELARKIKDETGLNVTYNDNENTQGIAMRYGLPDSLDSTLAVIVTSGPKIMKYMLPNKLTVENAAKLVEQVQEGTAKPFWRSDAGLSKGENDGLTPITAATLVEHWAAKKTFVMVVFWPGGIGEAFVNATAVAKQVNKGVIFGKFCASTNDWPSETDLAIATYPWLLVYVEGQQVHSGPVKETTEQIAMEIAAALATTPKTRTDEL